MSKNLIAFNLPFNTSESIIKSIFKNVVDTPFYNYFCFNIHFYINIDHKNAIIEFYSEKDANEVIAELNKKQVNGIYFDFVFLDSTTSEFLKNNNKIFYIKLKSIKYKLFTDKIKEFDPTQKLHFNEEKQIGKAIFENVEETIKAWHYLKNNFSDSVELSIKSFKSLFINNAKNKDYYIDQFLKEGNDASIFIFDIPHKEGKPLIDADFIRQLFSDHDIDPNESSISFHTKLDYDSKPSFYAIVIFKNNYAATKAIRDLNYTILDGVPIRLVLADTETRRKIAKNYAKLLVSNLDPDAEVSQLHDAFLKYGKVIECEIPTDNGVSRGYGFVQFCNLEDAKKAKTDLIDAKINGRPIQLDFVEDMFPNDPQKKFLFKDYISDTKYSYFTEKEEDFDSFLFCRNLSLFVNNNFDVDNYFVIYVNENQIECNRFIASFLSRKIANNDSLSNFEIKVYPLERSFSNEYEICSFIISLLNKKKISLKKLETRIIKTIEQIISSILNNEFKERLNKTVFECSEYLLGKIKTNFHNDDFILNFIVLIEVFSQLGNITIIQYLSCLLLDKINQNDSIKNDQVLYITTSIKNIMKDTSSNQCEIDYIKNNFYEIDPNILNEIELKTIEDSIIEIDKNDKNEDMFLNKLLRLDNCYLKKLIKYVKFEKVSNEMMKIFISSIDFSIVDETLLNSVAVRLNCPLIPTIPIFKRIIRNPFSNVIIDGIQNLITKRKFNDFTIFVNNKQIEFNRLFITLFSPTIEKYIQTDITCDSFYLKIESKKVDFFNKFVNSLSFFMSKEEFFEFDQITIENKYYEYLCQIKQMFEKEGITYLKTFFNTLHLKEKSAFNYGCWISLFISLGNLTVSEFLINSLVQTNNEKIKSAQDVINSLHHKEICKYEEEIDVDISSEKFFITTNFNQFFRNINDTDEIDEILWKIISIQLSLDVYIKLD